MNLLRPFGSRFFLFVVASCLAACSTAGGDSVWWRIKPYQADVVQGNVVTQETLSQLRPGLSRDQTRMLLGSPLLADAFHGDRWDYVFNLRRQGMATQNRRVTVYFDKDRVSRFDADAVPTEQAFVASINVKKPDRRERTLVLSAAEIAALPLPIRAEPIKPSLDAASAPMRNYPPLEPLTTTR
jgi:outer membrane protein assembly factor BamE